MSNSSLPRVQHIIGSGVVAARWRNGLLYKLYAAAFGGILVSAPHRDCVCGSGALDIRKSLSWLDQGWEWTILDAVLKPCTRPDHRPDLYFLGGQGAGVLHCDINLILYSAQPV